MGTGNQPDNEYFDVYAKCNHGRIKHSDPDGKEHTYGDYMYVRDNVSWLAGLILEFKESKGVAIVYSDETIKRVTVYKFGNN